jgi:hypothetical protein
MHTGREPGIRFTIIPIVHRMGFGGMGKQPGDHFLTAQSGRAINRKPQRIGNPMFDHQSTLTRNELQQPTLLNTQ